MAKTIIGEVNRIDAEDGMVRIEYKDDDDEFAYEWAEGSDYKEKVKAEAKVGAKVKFPLVDAGCGWDLRVVGPAPKDEK